MSAAWRDLAACRGMDTDLFFPPRGNTGRVRTAKAVCSRCPVRSECLGFALALHINHGIWGGTCDRDRRLLRKAAS